MKDIDWAKIRNENKIVRGRYSEQGVRDKVGKNTGWNIVCSKWNVEDGSITFEVLINANETEVRSVSHDQICQMFNWKDFKFTIPNKEKNKQISVSNFNKYSIVHIIPTRLD